MTLSILTAHSGNHNNNNNSLLPSDKQQLIHIYSSLTRCLHTYIYTMSKGKSAHSASSAATVTFQRYDTEFQEILQQIEQSLSSNSGTENGNQQQQQHGDYTNHLIQQGHDLLKQMSVEARSASDHSNNNAAMKNELLNHVRSLKSQLNTLQSKVSSQSLFGNHNNNSSNNSNNSQYDKNRQMLEKNENMLLQQNDTLERAKRSILETEQVALEISDELVQNRQTLISSQNRIHQVSGMTNQAKQLLSSMSQRQVQQKMIMYGITISLVVAFFLLLYSMWG
jgi:vesicle transport through interaction with t-SNAREs 1